jgi:hypothetical protein
MQSLLIKTNTYMKVLVKIHAIYDDRPHHLRFCVCS